MEVLIKLLTACITILTVFFVIIKKFKIASLLQIVTWGLLPGLSISLIYLYAMPVDPYAINNIYSSIICYYGIACVCSFLCTIPIKSRSVLPLHGKKIKSSLKKRWLYFGIGAVVGFSGLVISLFLIYVHSVKNPFNPYVTASLFLSCTLVSCLFLYASSRMNSKKRPNLMRWIVFSWAWLTVSPASFFLSLIFIYALPFRPQICEPLASSMCYWAVVFYSLLCLKMISDYITRRFYPSFPDTFP